MSCALASNPGISDVSSSVETASSSDASPLLRTYLSMHNYCWDGIIVFIVVVVVVVVFMKWTNPSCLHSNFLTPQAVICLINLCLTYLSKILLVSVLVYYYVYSYHNLVMCKLEVGKPRHSYEPVDTIFIPPQAEDSSKYIAASCMFMQETSQTLVAAMFAAKSLSTEDNGDSNFIAI